MHRRSAVIPSCDHSLHRWCEYTFKKVCSDWEIVLTCFCFYRCFNFYTPFTPTKVYFHRNLWRLGRWKSILQLFLFKVGVYLSYLMQFFQYTSKIVCIHFHQYWVFLELNILDIKLKEAKFLGLIFDTNQTFTNCLHFVETSCQIILDILQVVGHTDWGPDRTVLLCRNH